MRAVWMKEFGGPEVLVASEAPDPEPGPGQVLIDVMYVNVTFVETQIRSGHGPFTPELPIVPGNGVGGVIRAVGSGVDAGLAGTRVVSSTGGSGAYAELVVVEATTPFEVPAQRDLDDAVAVLADGRTANMLATAAQLSAGDRVLVEAAAGGVGSLLVQLAGSAGSTVIAAVGAGRKAEVARGLGADVVVDYRDPDWTRAVRNAVGAVDVVFDGVGGHIARDAFALLAPSGRMVSFGLASGSWADITDEEATARAVTLLRPQATPAQLRDFTQTALEQAADGRLRPLIGQRFKLGDAAAAHAAIEARTTVGKTLLDVAG